ncbi:hypothetical protein PPTG_24729 [Phytophthora nicotianae INRA-310]|uniref:Uncharacterized protein n=2 Tax=Phytophthora nicotianae TaxID=4792 RepID=W2PAK8_PHYN3|nr:hypothetical protein PPTG_24729 [Phytophthora nicotianae INRA-310]ETM98087.1 hypothetical protein PPTG_24729 [Phytophthora nicotianae INRA-310]
MGEVRSRSAGRLCPKDDADEGAARWNRPEEVDPGEGLFSSVRKNWSNT